MVINRYISKISSIIGIALCSHSIAMAQTYPTPAPTYSPVYTPAPQPSPPSCTVVTASASCSCRELLSDGTISSNIAFGARNETINAQCFVSTQFNVADVFCGERSISDKLNNVFSPGALNCYCSTPYFYAHGMITNDFQRGSIGLPSLFQPGDLLEGSAEATPDTYRFSASYRYDSCTGERGHVSFSSQHGLGSDYFSGDFNFPSEFGSLYGSGMCTENGEFDLIAGGGGTLTCRQSPGYCNVSAYIAANRRADGSSSVSTGADLSFSMYRYMNDDPDKRCQGTAQAFFNNEEKNGQDNASFGLNVGLQWFW